MRGLTRRDPADTGERAALRSRKRFARRQWRRRWLAWRYVLVAVLVVALVAGGTWLVYFSSVLTVKRVDIEGNDLLTRNQVLRRPGFPTASSWPGSTSTRSRPACAPWPPYAPSTSPASGPTPSRSRSANASPSP